MDFKNKIILITGGTGSFGRTLLERLLKEEVQAIRIFSRDELKQDEMRHHYKDPRIQYFLGDVRDPSTFGMAFREVDYVFHAAALKQVPSCEEFPLEAIKTNVFGSENVMNECLNKGVKKAIFLSTDKAPMPINAMGMSKALMEKIVLAKAAKMKASDTIFCLTRYGNVLMSRGSVIPLFIEQIKAGEKVTITDPHMTRFVMSLEEAIELVIYALEHGEQGDLFIQKAPAARVDTIATALYNIFAEKPNIEYIGFRPGERLHETLASEEEMAHAFDLGNYLRIPFKRSNIKQEVSSFNSLNTQQLDVKDLEHVLRKVGVHG